jgi:hypothetical protein
MSTTTPATRSTATLAALARTADPNAVLRRLLAADAVVTGAVLVAYGAAVGLLASRTRPAALPVRAVIETNLAWTLLSCAALALWLTPTAPGAVWTVLQALVVAALAVLQHLALKGRQDISD